MPSVFVIAFVAGVAAVQLLERLPASWMALLLLASLLPAWRFRSIRWAMAAVAGFAWAVWRAGGTLAVELPAAWEGVDLRLAGVVDSLPHRLDDGTVRFEARVQALERDGEAVSFDARVRLYWRSPPEAFAPGQAWVWTVRLKRPHGLQNPGGFDYERWLFRKGIRATGSVREARSGPAAAAGLGPAVHGVRGSLARAAAGAGVDPAHVGFLQALALGAQSAIPPGQWASLNATGTTHLVTVSGLHVALVAGLVFLLGRALWRRLPARALLAIPAPVAGAWAALIAATVYAALAGFAVPVQRALIMGAVALGPFLLRRHVPAPRALGWAAVAVLLHDPMAVLEPGFWLSFAAVAALLYGMRGQTAPDAPAPSLWWRFGRAQWVVALALLPVTLLWFQRASLVAPLVNVLAVPWVGALVTPLALAGTLLAPVSPGAGGAVLTLAGWGLDAFWLVVDRAAGLPWAQVHLAAPGPIPLALALCGAAFLLAPAGLPGRRLGWLMLLPVAFPPGDRVPPGGVSLTVLDVGQGLATVVRTERHALLFDAGPGGDGLDAGRAVVVPYLIASGIRRLDRVVSSHGDSDHAGGIAAVHAAIPVGDWVAGEPERIPVPAMPCLAGMEWNWDGVRFTVLHPQPDTARGPNRRSCVLRIDAGSGSALLTADLEGRDERALVTAGAPLRADVLVVPHHGSKRSSGAEFIDAVAPAHAVIAASYRNRFGFPHPEVVARYRERGASLRETWRSGALRLDFEPGRGWRVRAQRDEARRYWHSVSPG